MAQRITPITNAEDSEPTKMLHCCHLGVAPTKKPVLRSCDVVPPLLDAMHTTAAMEMATSRYCGAVQPKMRKIRHVKSSVAMVMPEIGLLDEPISPVKREETVTNRKPKSTIK